MPHQILVQFHCHHHSILNKKASKHVMSQLSPSVEVLEQGCCGMAGSFGFEAEKFNLSRTIAERGVLGPIGKAGSDVELVVDGFSCREQIEQLTGRKTLHPAELLSQAL
jgi:Fe-S oxidoreductase